MRLARALVAVEFALIASFYLAVALFVDRGMDARIYHRAVTAWVAGGDPWAAEYAGVAFAAPPPTLLAVLPTAPLPEDAAVVVIMALSLAASVFIVWRLRLPAFWLLFPPLVEGVTVGSLDAVVAALLLVGAGPLAALAKIYAVVPLAMLRRWRALAATVGLVLISIPLLPWGQFLASDPFGTLSAQSEGRSAWEVPILAPVVLLALWRLGRRRAAWLSVPALWPATQLHYAILAMPAIGLVAGSLMALPLPGSAAVAVVAAAIAREVTSRRDARAGAS